MLNLNYIEKKGMNISMQPKVYATKILDNNGDVFDIQFDVIFEDEVGEKTGIGSYSVGSDDSIVGEVDQYIVETHEEYIDNAKRIILENGLLEISSNILPKEYNYDGKIMFDTVSRGAFDRAQKYIENKNIKCGSEEYLNFSLDRYNNQESHKSL